MTEALTLSEAAARAGVHRRTMRAWVRAGRLPATTTPGGHYRIDGADLAAMRLTTGEFARAVGVCRETAARWTRAGKLDVVTDASGRHLIAASEVARIGARSRS